PLPGSCALPGSFFPPPRTAHGVASKGRKIRPDSISKVTAEEIRMGADGFATATPTLCPSASSAASSCTRNCPLFTNCVDSGMPFQSTCASGLKLLPLIVKVSEGLPARVEAGDSELISGGSPCTTNGISLETNAPGAGDWVVMGTTPAVSVRAAGTCAVNVAASTKVVFNACPFHSTCVPSTKPNPVTVSVKGGPCTV